MKEEEILYVCVQCKYEENIPKEVVEYFDEMDQSNIDEPPCFSCEKCNGIMRPKNIMVYMEKLINLNIKTIENSKLYGFSVNLKYFLRRSVA